MNGTVTTKSVTTSTPTLTTTAMTTQYLMYTMVESQTVYSYTLDVDRDPVKNGEFKIPYSTELPSLVFNSQSSRLKIIGDRYFRSNKNHKLMTITGIFSNAADSLFNGDVSFEVAHSPKVGTLVFSGAGYSGSTRVYIITQNSDWDKIKSSDKYLSPFQNPDPSSDYYGYGVVEQENKIYLVGGFTGGRHQNTIQVINFQNVDKLQIAKTRQWIFMENLKNAVYEPAVIYRKEKLLIVGRTWNPSTCQDVQYLNLASNLTGVYAGTIGCGKYDEGYYHPGIYSIVGGDVSVFGGSNAEESCIQQTASGDNLGRKWKCVLSSKSAFEGLGYHYDGSSGDIRYSNFVL